MTEENPIEQNYAAMLRLIGQATIDWNEVESLWYLIYTCLMHETPRDKTDVVFSQFQTGATQRELIMAVADPAFRHHQKYRKRVGQLSAKTNDLSGIRNAIVHGMYRFDPLNAPNFRVRPKTVAQKRPNRLSGKDIFDEVTAHVAAIHTHIIELDDFRMELIKNFLPPSKQ